MKLQTILTIIGLIVYSQSVTYLKVVNSLDSEAVCLDGQQSFIYLTGDFLESSDGLLVYFMDIPSSLYCGGSSLSSSLDNCISAQTQISSFWKASLNITEGILSDQQFKSFTKVIIPYCDGALFQGLMPSPTRYKNKDLFFKGNRIVKSNLAFIDKNYNLSKYQKIVVAGSGIGAIGAMTWARFFRDQMVLHQNNKEFKLVFDSYPNSFSSFKTKKNQFEISLQNLLQISTTDGAHPFVLCSLRNQGHEHKCFLFDQGYQYLNFPVMAIESQYDRFTISKVLQVSCVSSNGSLDNCSGPQRTFIEEHRSQRLVSLFRFANFHDNSLWSISCSGSDFLGNAFDHTRFSIGRQKPRNSIESFIFQKRSTSFDPYPWPSNSGCSGR